MSIMSQLEFEMDFSDSEKQIARYILEHDDEVLSLSSRELASKTYTSPATIVRLCRKLGLKGYDAFKIQYSAELQSHTYSNDEIDVNFPFKASDSLQEISYKMSELDNEVVKGTMQLIDYKVLQEVIDHIYNYQYIDIYGSGNSLLAAMSFEHKMMRINRVVNLKVLHGEEIFMAQNSDENHLAILISYSGETADLLRNAKILKSRNTKIIGITSVGDNELSRISDLVLNVYSKEKIFSKIAPFASQISFEYLLNIIYSGVFQKDYENNINHKINNDRLFDNRRPTQSPVKEEG